MVSSHDEGGRSVAKGFAVLSVAMILVKLLSVLYVPFLRLIIGNEAMGIYYSAYSVFTVVYTLANCGFPVAIAKMVSEFDELGNYKDSYKTFKIARTLLVGLGVVISLLLLLLSKPLAAISGSTNAILAIRMLSPAILITTILSAYKGYFQGKSNMTPIAICQVLEQIFNIIFSLGCAYFLISYGNSYGAAGGTVGTVVGAIVASLYLIYVYKKENGKKRLIENKIGVKRISTERILKRVIAYTIPITISVGLQNSGPLIDLIVVKARLFSLGFSQQKVDILWGFLSLYNTLVSVPMAIMGALALAILPVISRHEAAKNKKALKKSVSSIYRVSYMIAVPSAVGMAVLSGPILQILGYDKAIGRLLIWGVVSIVLNALTLVQTSILQGAGKVKEVTVYSIIGIIAKFIVNYIVVGIRGVDILGAIFANTVFYLVMVVLNQKLMNTTFKFKSRIFIPCIKPIIGSFFMGIVAYITYSIMNPLFGFIGRAYITNAIATAISIIIAIIVYGVALIAIGGIKKSDLALMPSKITKIIPKRILNIIR